VTEYSDGELLAYVIGAKVTGSLAVVLRSMIELRSAEALTPR
jgi:hypothetical protein